MRAEQGPPAPGGCRTGRGPTGRGLQWWHRGRAVAPLCPPAPLWATAPVPECSSSASPGAAVPAWEGCWRRGTAGRAAARWGAPGTGGPGQRAMGTGSAGRQVPRTSRASHPRPPRNCLCSTASRFPTYWEKWPQFGAFPITAEPSAGRNQAAGKAGGRVGGAPTLQRAEELHPQGWALPLPRSSATVPRPGALARLGAPCLARNGGHPVGHRLGTDTRASV